MGRIQTDDLLHTGRTCIYMYYCYYVHACRYVGEDSMEVEVWSCPTSRRPSEGSDSGPGSDDTLLGTVSISLQALSSKDTIRQAF